MEQTEETDEQLMARVTAGDSDALSLLYDRYATAVMGVAWRILNDQAKAEDVLQETFWRVWDKADSFQTARGSFAGWMMSICRRLAIDQIRRAKVRPQPARNEKETQKMVSAPAAGTDVVEMTHTAIQSEKIREALTALSPEQYQVIEMAYYRGMTRKEIAQATETPIGTVHTRARLAFKQLRKLLRVEKI